MVDAQIKTYVDDAIKLPINPLINPLPSPKAQKAIESNSNDPGSKQLSNNDEDAKDNEDGSSSDFIDCTLDCDIAQSIQLGINEPSCSRCAKLKDIIDKLLG